MMWTYYNAATDTPLAKSTVSDRLFKPFGSRIL